VRRLARWTALTDGQPERAAAPEDLGRLFLERANAGDVEGVVALYAPDAVLAGPDGARLRGHGEIRAFYAGLLRGRPSFRGEQSPAVLAGDLALTSTRFSGGVTAEVARRAPDGTWLWVIDQPNLLR
jgi:ketosteroid isomerase-like protein